MSAAQEIWARWDNQDEQILPAGGNVDTFLEFFVNQVAELPSDPEHTSVKQWSELLSNCDYQLNAETRAAAYTIGGYWEFDMVYGSDIFEKMITTGTRPLRTESFEEEIPAASSHQGDFASTREVPSGGHGGYGGKFHKHGNRAGVRAGKQDDGANRYVTQEMDQTPISNIRTRGFLFLDRSGDRRWGHGCFEDGVVWPLV